jgi:putative ABC transport system permease protein
MDTLLQDVRYALRTLLKSPAFTAIAVLTLALGIGANSAVFSIVNGVLLRALPYANADRAVMLWSTWTGYPRTWLSEPEVADYRTQTQVFDLFAPFALGSASLTGDGEPERVAAGFLSKDVLPVLGASPLIGRGFTAAEDSPDSIASRVALLGEGLWRRRYAADPGMLGRTITIGARSFTVVGVLADDFRLPNDFVGEPAQVYTPLGLNPVPDENNRGSHYLFGVGRLRPDVTPERAQSAMSAFVGEMKRRHPNYGPDFDVRIVPVRAQVSGDIRPALLVLLGAVGFVLLIACANVANLLLARAEVRHKEIAIRTALGAGRGRLVRQLITESLVLSLIGGALGLLLAVWGTRALLDISPPNIPRVDAIGVDARVALFTLGVSLFTGLLFGVVPAVQSAHTDVQGTLKESGRGTTVGARRQRLRRALVISEVALAMVLVIGAGLMIKSFARLLGVDPGVRAERLLTLELSLPQAKYGQPQSRAFYRQLVDRVAALPGVEAVGAVRELPFATQIGDWSFSIIGRPRAGPHEPGPAGDWQVVSPGYFRAIGIPLRAGRYLEASDAETSQQVVVLSQTLARTFWPKGDAVGQQIMLGGADSLPRTIVGLVGDVKHKGLDAETKPQMYFPHAQFPRTAPFPINKMSLVIRTRGEPLALANAVRAEVKALDADVPISRVKSMEDVLATSTSVRQLNVMLLGVFAAVALILAAVGIYGVMAYTVTQRTHEIGVRMALGATAREVLALVLGQGLRLVVVGLALGLLTAMALARVIQSMLFGISATDPLTFAAVSAILAAVALLATYLPARRATRVDPLVAMRME